MASLNLHSRDPVPEPDDETTLPETPPGLDAIRAWLRKPRPWVRGVRLWVVWILSGPPKAWQWLRKHGPRIAKSLRRIAAEGTVTRRVLERVGHLLRETAVKLDAAFKAFRDPRGESQEATGELDQLGETFRRLGERVTFGARIVGIVVSGLNRLAGFFPESPADTPVPPPQPESESRPTPGPPSPPPGDPPKEPPPQPPAPGPPETQPPAAGPPETQPPAAGPPETQPPAAGPPETQPPAAGSPKTSGPPTESPETDVPAPGAPPPRTPPTPAVSPEAAWEARVKGLPPMMHKWVRDLGPRPRRESLHALILKICDVREWTTSEELARFLDMHQSSLVQRHLSALVNAGLLELKYPDNPRDVRQAYRTRPEAAPYM